MPDNNPTTPAGQAPGGDGTQPGQAPNNSNPDGQAPHETPNQSTIKSLEDAQKVIEDLRKEQASNRKKLKDFEAAQNQAETDRQATEAQKLKEAGEFKALYEKTDAKVKELEPVQGKYEELSRLAKSRLEAEVKDWPDKLKAKLPQGETVDVLEYARAIDNFRDLAEDYAKQQAGAGYGRNSQQPNPAGAAQPNTANELQQTGRYSRF